VVLNFHGPTYFPATNSLPTKSSHYVFPIRIAKPKFLVGRLGEEPRGYVSGVTFCDPELDFWQIEFPPPEQPSQPRSTALESVICGARSLVEQSEVEAGVFLLSQSVLR
jgi:hypothetical protein